MSAPLNPDSLPAGRELDALVAEKVMGLPTQVTLSHARVAELLAANITLGVMPVPHYSASIAAAWEVVEKLGDQGRLMTLYAPGACCAEGFTLARKENGWLCYFSEEASEFEYHAHVYEYGNTAPLAICRAALRAVEA